MVKAKTNAKVIVAKRKKKEEPIAPAVPVDESVDDLLNLQEEGESDHYLMHFKRACTSLKQYGFGTISTLKLFYDTYGEKYCIRKLTEIKGIGKKKAEDMLTRAICYNYPKGYIPQSVTLPSWVKTNVVEKEKELEKEVKEDNDKLLYPEEGGKAPEPKTTKIADPITVEEVDTVNVNVAEYASNLIDESELPGILLSIIFDLFDSDSINKERIDPLHIEDGHYEQLNIFYNDKVILINKEYLLDLFNAKCRTLNTIDNLNRIEMFKSALANASCVFRKKNVYDGHTYYWARKGMYLGSANMLNYVEINIIEAEAIMNRKFNIISSEKLNQTMIDLGIKPIYDVRKETSTSIDRSKSSFYILPNHCINESNRKCFKFTIASINDRLNFDMKDIDWKYGTYSFKEDDIESGELLLGRGFTDEEYDEITRLVVDFLTK